MNYYIDDTKVNTVELHYEKGGIEFILNAVKINNFSIDIELLYCVPLRTHELGDITTSYLINKVKNINQFKIDIFGIAENDNISYNLIRDRMDFVIESMIGIYSANKYFPENFDLLLDSMTKVIINSFFK